MSKCTLQLEELICPMCATKVETALRGCAGVKDVKILFNASKAKIEFDETIVSKETLANACISIGYDVLKII